jgi:hypothetical protein
MKYALFEFAPIEGSGSTQLAVGESCWIIDVEDGMLILFLFIMKSYSKYTNVENT